MAAKFWRFGKLGVNSDKRLLGFIFWAVFLASTCSPNKQEGSSLFQRKIKIKHLNDLGQLLGKPKLRTLPNGFEVKIF